jgi:uncharacterized membrane protein YraQ (UPF0718 family)
MKRLKKLDTTLLVLVALLLIALGLAFLKGGRQVAWEGAVQSARLFESVWLRLPLGFALGGMIQVLVPRQIIARWLGPASGLKGILIGSFVSVVLSGAPYVMLPIVASLYLAGAGPGPVIALMTGQALLGVQNLIVWQIPFLGVGVPLARFIVSLIVTPLVGITGAAVFKLLGRLPDLQAKEELRPEPEEEVKEA